VAFCENSSPDEGLGFILWSFGCFSLNRGETFSNQTVYISGQAFIRCKFTACTLILRETCPLAGMLVERCNWHVDWVLMWGSRNLFVRSRPWSASSNRPRFSSPAPSNRAVQAQSQRTTSSGGTLRDLILCEGLIIEYRDSCIPPRDAPFSRANERIAGAKPLCAHTRSAFRVAANQCAVSREAERSASTTTWKHLMHRVKFFLFCFSPF